MKNGTMLNVMGIIISLCLLTACSEPKSEPPVNGKADDPAAAELAAIKEDTAVMAEFAKNRMAAEQLRKEFHDKATQTPAWLGKEHIQLKGTWFPQEEKSAGQSGD